MKKIHIAIMRKSWGLTQKILSGEKAIDKSGFGAMAAWITVDSLDKIKA